MLIEIVFDHPDFVVVNKPSGIAVQNEIEQNGILPILCKQLHVEKLWLVHRLDKVTSGLLILAKSANAAAAFGKLFEERKIEKFYIALSSNKPKKKQGTVKGSMKKVRDGKWMLSTEGGSNAITQFFSYSILPGVRLFLLKPHTGKTHQLRVMLKSMGSPIIGDKLYEGTSKAKIGDAERTYLHAYALKFTYLKTEICLINSPSSGELFKLTELHEHLQSLQQPWCLQWPKLKK